MDIAPADLARIRELYGEGRYRQAYEVVKAAGPLRRWAGTAARLMGGRLAIQLGAPKLGRGLHLLAVRATPSHPEALYYHARYRLERFGPLAAWRFMRDHPDWSIASPELHADWLSLTGFVAARLRDFDRAERWLNRAETVAPARPWPQIERAGVYEFADRLDDALAAGRRALELHPWFRPGVQAVSHLLVRLGRDREALDLLTEAAGRLESGIVCAQLAGLQNDLGHHADAARNLDRYAELSPLLEPDAAKWLAARRADTNYWLGDFAAAATQARAAGEEFFTAFADRLETVAASGEGQGASEGTTPAEAAPDPGSAASGRLPLAPRPSRIVLPVPLPGGSPFEMLSAFWDAPFPPAADAHGPTDGLPDATERVRAEKAGWAGREFTFGPDIAAEVVARGVPFLATFVEAGFSQSRLVVGADKIRNTVFLADGTERRPVEAPLAPLLDRYKASGPRALAVVPVAEAGRLDGLAFPDADAYDALDAVQRPLLTHDREAAAAALAAMRGAFPDHRLALSAELALARYDAHPVKLLDVYDRVLARFPHDTTAALGKAGVLRELNRHPERLALLEAEGWPAAAEPLLTQSLAQALLPTPGRQAEAERLLRRSVRNRPTAAAGYYLLATLWWERRLFPEAAEMYRLACCLEEREDQFAEAYVRAARVTEQVPEALRLLQQKAGRAAVPTPSACRSLFHALLDRDEPEQAFASLDQAVRKLQDSDRKPAEKDRDRAAALADLLLFRAESHAHFGRAEKADADLAAAKPLAGPAAWHRSAARVARLKPDLAAALDHFQQAVKHDPLSAEGHRAVVGLLAETAGRAAARVHVLQACQKHPHFYPLLKTRAEVLCADPDAADPERAVRDMLEECDHDAWAHRQLALFLADRRRHPEALAEIQRAGELEPVHPWYSAVLVQVHRRADRTEEALAACREALARNVDQEPLVADLVQLSRGRQEKLESLRWLAAELRRQPHTGEGLLAFVAQAFEAFKGDAEPDDHQELLGTLEDILDARPDLWQAWSLVVQQMAVMGRLDEAHALAREAAERFPLLAKLWIDLAQVCHAKGDSEGRVEALRQAVAVAPGWSIAARELAEALEDADERDEAVAVLERTAARSPTDPFAHGFLAERLWDEGRSEEALERAKTAVKHEPGYDWMWTRVQLWSDRLDRPEEAADLARALTRDRPGDPRGWLRLARLLPHPRHNDEVLAALGRVTAAEPKNVEAHDLKAERLAEMGRFDDALAAAQPPEFAADPPMILQGRVAWVEAKRGNYGAAIPPMQALVSVDPTYIWGWQQLAEWYNETGRPQGYLESASELVRLQPGHPVGWMMRGEAKIQTGDRDGGKSDLREALKISPNFSHAAAVLFDAHLADDEFRDARSVLAVLQEHAAGPEVAVKQIQLAARTGDGEGAARAFAEICEGPGGSPFPLQAALSEMKSAGWEDRAGKILRNGWQSGGPFQPWVPVFWVESADGQAADPGERLRAAEAAVKAFPKFVPGHDTKAEQLALAGRFEEAQAACRPADLGDPPPIELRARAAWVEARRGDRARAISLMKQVVADDPKFVLGWRQLAAWYDAAGRHRDCLDASDEFVKLEPEHPLAHVYRGEARRNLGDRRGALADFQRAFDLDPGFEAAGLDLVTEQLAADDIAGAGRTLAKLREHADGPLVRLRAVELACRQADPDAAATHLRGLATDPEVTRGMLREAAAAFDAAGWGPRATDELRVLASTPDANPDAAGLWAERALDAGMGPAVSDRADDLLAKNPAAGREVVLAQVWAQAGAGRPVSGLVTLHSEALRADDGAWAKAGAALVAGRNYSHAVAWLADWRERDGIEPWMLAPLHTALRALDRTPEATAVCRAAARIGGPDELLADFRAWLALDLALEGDAEEAAAQVAKVDAVTTADGTRLVLAMAEAVVMVRRAGPGGKGAAFAEAKDHLRTAAGSVAAADVPAGAARAYRRVADRVAADAGTLAAKLWAVWQRFQPWLKG